MTDTPFLTMFSGDSQDIIVTVPGVDMTGASATAVLAASQGGAISVTKSTGGSGITIDSATKLTVTLQPADTASLSGTYWFECQVTLSSGAVGTVKTGYVEIKADTIT